jgi:hypothetical protein
MVITVDSGVVTGTDVATYDARAMSPSNVLLAVATLQITAASPGPKTLTVQVPAGTEHVELRFTSQGTVGHTLSYDMQFDAYCGGQVPGGTVSSCCPPDTSTQATLDAILTLVTLIQRQNVAFGFVEKGSAHAGISGDGELSIQGLVGVRVDLTTTPARVGVTSGDPDTLWNVGWVRLGTDSAWGERYFVDADPWQLLPAQAGVYTRLGYSIPSDVTVSITELEREP